MNISTYLLRAVPFLVSVGVTVGLFFLANKINPLPPDHVEVDFVAKVADCKLYEVTRFQGGGPSGYPIYVTRCPNRAKTSTMIHVGKAMTRPVDVETVNQ